MLDRTVDKLGSITPLSKHAANMLGDRPVDFIVAHLIHPARFGVNDSTLQPIGWDLHGLAPCKPSGVARGI